jgi:hypothetical protein
MVEPFAGSSGMAIVNQLTPSLGAYAEGADQGWCCRVYIIMATGQEKNNKKTHQFFLFFMNYQSPTPPKQWNQPHCMLPPGCNDSSITSPFLPWLGNQLGIPQNLAIIPIPDLLNLEFSSEFNFSDRKLCSCQFVTHSCWFGTLSHHPFFQFHASENVPAFFWPANITSTCFEYPPRSHLLVLSRC